MLNPGNTGNFHSFVDNDGRVCTKCKEYKIWNLFAKNRKKPNGENYLVVCLDCERERNRLLQVKIRKELKERVLSHYSTCCACCGELEPAFLTIDHVANDGASHRRSLGKPSGSEFYRWLEKSDYPEGFQVLCWNCNCGKRVNGGMCPHSK